MPGLKSAVRRRRITAVTVKLAILGVVALVLGFVGFVWQLPGQEEPSIAAPTASWC